MTDWSVKYSDNFGGPSHKRSCTDLYCFLIFVVFLCCWSAIGYYAYWNGEIRRLIAPKDSYGRNCGVDEDVKNKKYLFFFDITECVSLSVFLFGCPTKQICVEKCPHENWFSNQPLQNSLENWKSIREKLICEDSSVAKTVNSISTLHRVIEDGKCAAYYVKSTSAIFNLCLPNPLDVKDVEKSYGAVEQTKTAQNYFNYISEISTAVQKDTKKSWHFVILFVVTAVIICLFTIIIMGVITKIFVWMILCLILLLLCYSMVVTYVQYESISSANNFSNSTDNLRNIHFESLYGQLSWIFQQKETWLILFVTSAFLFTLFALLIIFLRSRIGLAIMLIGEGSKAINTIKSTLCLPIVTRILQLSIVIWFILIFVYLKSLGNSVYTVQHLTDDRDCRCTVYRDNDWCLPSQFEIECSSISKTGPCTLAKCAFKEFRSPTLKFYFHLYNFFGLLWSLYFISGFNRIILSFCFKTWYWTYNKHEIPFFTLFYSVYTTLRFHLGTVAIGSFLIATCGFLRTLLKRAHRVVKNTDGLLMQCTMWSMRCCFWFLQKFLIFISNNAYIMCSINGEGFFSSAHEAFGLLTRNVVRVIVLDKVLDFLMLVGKLAVTSIMVILSYFTFSSPSLSLNYPWVPVILVGILTWIIASSFFTVYTIAVDTLFLSFLRDIEMNNGSQNKPYYMSQRLKYILKKKKNKVEK